MIASVLVAVNFFEVFGINLLVFSDLQKAASDRGGAIKKEAKVSTS